MGVGGMVPGAISNMVGAGVSVGVGVDVFGGTVGDAVGVSVGGMVAVALEATGIWGDEITEKSAFGLALEPQPINVTMRLPASITIERLIEHLLRDNGTIRLTSLLYRSDK